MTLYDGIQAVVIGGAVFGSAIYALGRVAPKLRQRAGIWLAQPGSPRPLAALGRVLAAGSGGCGSGCDTCGTCPSNTEVKPAVAGKHTH